MPVRHLISSSLALALILLHASCGTSRPKDVSGFRYHSSAQVRAAVAAGPTTLHSISEQLEINHQDFVQLTKDSAAAWRKRGYLNSNESDRMETLLFRFTTAQDALSDMIAALGGSQPSGLFPDENLKTGAHLLATDAQLLLLYQRAEWVAEFADDPIAIAKLNEAFFRSEIPAGTYDKLHLSVTSKDSSQRLHAAWILFKHQRDAGDFQPLTVAKPSFTPLIASIPSDYRQAQAAVQQVSENPVLRDFTHSEAAALARKTGRIWDSTEYKARSLLFKNVSRIKSPTAKLIKFSSAQHAQVNSLLQPGDIILTYTAGYTSDVFIPGRFKHGITYVGSPAQRKALGLSISHLPELATPERKAVTQALAQAKDSRGQDADVIEAVAEGVIFNHFSYLMDTHINRIAVLRPNLSKRDRASFLTGIFALHGDSYDFLFDFGDASRQVCTEVIYRAIDGLNGIHFPLTRRGGHPTISADDIVDYHFDTAGRHFDFVLFAEQDSSRPGHRAIVRTGPQGEQKLKTLMGK